jgi:hypothetical protein
MGGRLGGGFFDSTKRAKESSGRHHGRRHGGAQAQATRHETKQGFFLRDLEGKGILFCFLSAAETIERRSATRRRLGRPSTAAGTASDSALDQRTSLASTV